MPLILGAYTLVSRIGGGGIGAVYLAYDAEEKPWAVKLLKVAQPPIMTPAGRVDGDPDIDRNLRSFKQEAGRLYALSAGRQNEDRVPRPEVLPKDSFPYYFVMEYIPWPSLAAEWRQRAGRPLPPRQLAVLGIELMGVLRLLEDNQTVHADLKPANLLVDFSQLTDARVRTEIERANARLTGAREPPRGERWIRIVDLGSFQLESQTAGRLVRIRGDGGVTEPFASPEHLQRDDAIRLAREIGGQRASSGMTTTVTEIDQLPEGIPALTCASDIHSAGTVLWILATGENPYPDRGTADGRLAMSKRVEPNAGLPPELYEILAAMLDPNPGRRPATRAVEQRLGAWLASYAAPISTVSEAVATLRQRADAILDVRDAPRDAELALEHVRGAVDTLLWREYQQALYAIDVKVKHAHARLEEVDRHGAWERTRATMRVMDQEIAAHRAALAQAMSDADVRLAQAMSDADVRLAHDRDDHEQALRALERRGTLLLVIGLVLGAFLAGSAAVIGGFLLTRPWAQPPEEPSTTAPPPDAPAPGASTASPTGEGVVSLPTTEVIPSAPPDQEHPEPKPREIKNGERRVGKDPPRGGATGGGGGRKAGASDSLAEGL